jgi:hypothetical protein
MWMQTQRDRVKPIEEGAEPATKKTSKLHPKNEPFKGKNDKDDQENMDAESGGSSQSWGDLGSETATIVQTLAPDISNILATLAKSAVLKSSKTLPKPSSEPSYEHQGRNAKRTYSDVEDGYDDDDDASSFLSRDRLYALKKQRL